MWPKVSFFATYITLCYISFPPNYYILHLHLLISSPFENSISKRVLLQLALFIFIKKTFQLGVTTPSNLSNVSFYLGSELLFGRDYYCMIIKKQGLQSRCGRSSITYVSESFPSTVRLKQIFLSIHHSITIWCNAYHMDFKELTRVYRRNSVPSLYTTYLPIHTWNQLSLTSVLFVRSTSLASVSAWLFTTHGNAWLFFNNFNQSESAKSIF